MDEGTLIRLTSERTGAGEVIVRVDGELTAGTIDQFFSVFEPGTARADLTIDLRGLRSVDRKGLELLLELRESGCRFVGGSVYVNRLLEEECE